MKRLILVGLLGLAAPLAAAQQPASAPVEPASAATSAPAAEPAPEPAPPVEPAPAAALLPQVAIIDRKLGKGKEASAGRTLLVHYTGWLYDDKAKDKHGKKFDSSHDAGRTAIDFSLGAGRMIAGWEKGVPGMKAGGKRTLIVPPELGYGARGAGAFIPPNATLVFDIELLKVQ